MYKNTTFSTVAIKQCGARLHTEKKCAKECFTLGTLHEMTNNKFLTGKITEMRLRQIIPLIIKVFQCFSLLFSFFWDMLDN